MSLVKVWTDIGKGKNVSLLAKIVSQDNKKIKIRYLSKTDEDYKDCTVWRYEDDTYEVDDDYITDYLMTDDEFEVGYKAIPSEEGAFIFYDSDSEYLPTSDDEVSSESDKEEVDDEYDEDDGCVSEYDE